MSSIKLLLKCDCGNQIILGENQENFILMKEIDGSFILGSADITISNSIEDIKELDNSSEISSELEKIYIKCRECNNGFYLKGWSNKL
ncbi:hypothetical protein I9Y33_002683 [Clostridium perfringens]|nr:hypothetical protein [Clostridium perfringens]